MFDCESFGMPFFAHRSPQAPFSSRSVEEMASPAQTRRRTHTASMISLQRSTAQRVKRAPGQPRIGDSRHTLFERRLNSGHC